MCQSRRHKVVLLFHCLPSSFTFVLKNEMAEIMCSRAGYPSVIVRGTSEIECNIFK